MKNYNLWKTELKLTPIVQIYMSFVHTVRHSSEVL